MQSFLKVISIGSSPHCAVSDPKFRRIRWTLVSLGWHGKTRGSDISAYVYFSIVYQYFQSSLLIKMDINSQLYTTHHHGDDFSDVRKASDSLPLRPPVTSNESPLPSPMSSSSVSLQSLGTSENYTFLALVASDTATLQPSACSVTVPLHLPLALETDAPQHIVGDTFNLTGPIYLQFSKIA